MKSPKFISSSYMAMAQFYNNSQKDSSILYAKKTVATVQNTPFSNMNIYPAKLLLDIYRNTNVDSAFKYSEIYRMATTACSMQKRFSKHSYLHLKKKCGSNSSPMKR